jgi:hypothetical protein
MKDQEIKSILQESWRTLSDVASSMMIPSIPDASGSRAPKKIDAAAKALDLRVAE